MKSAFFASAARALALCAVLAGAACSAETQPVSSPKAAAPRCTEIPADAYPSGTIKVKTHTDFAKDHFRERVKQFAAKPLDCGKIIMLGDSLVELNDWPRSIRRGSALRNRGISGDTSDGLLLRLGEITASQPRAVFLMIGTNDLYTPNSPRTTVANITRAVDEIRAQSPDTMIFVQTVFPLRWDNAPNDKVRAINALLKKQGRKSRFIVLDTYALMADKDGRLKAAYTTDGLHLSAKGYGVWSVLVSATMRQYELRGEKP